MAIELLTERHGDQIAGVLGCWDRMLIFGTLPKICFAGGMTSFLFERNIRIFDYPRFAEPFRNRIRENAEKLAADTGIEIEFIRKRNFRKEDRVKQALAKRGEHPGLVCIFSAMEPCSRYKPWHNKQAGKTYLIPDDGKCLHYYFYFIDEDLGLCYVRVPTWLPCRLQIYFNGHNWLAGQLRKQGIEYRLIDNAFVEIADWPRAQRIANRWAAKRIHRKLDEFARGYCPVYRDFASGYHWSADQCEYATDIVYRKQPDLQAIYENLARTAIHTVKPDNIATFLGRKLSAQFEGEMGNRFNIRIEGTRIKHTMGPVSINVFDPNDETLLCSIVRGEFNISGLQNRTLRRHLPKRNSGQISRLLKRLRTHGLIKKIGRTYKYYVTAFGKQVVATALKLRELVIIPQLAFAPAR